MVEGFHIDLLKRQFEERKKFNPNYSLRAFAHHLSISPSILSRILSGKRSLSYKQALKLAKSLDLSEKEKIKFLAALESKGDALSDNASRSGIEKIDEDRFAIIADPVHYAVLELTCLDDFENDYQWMAKKLGIKVITAKTAFQRLIRVGLLKKVRGRYKKVEWMVTAGDAELTSRALKSHQLGVLEKSRQSLQHDPIEIRCHLGVMLTANPEKLEKAKKLIAESAERILESLDEGEQKEVYQLAISLFPFKGETQGVRHED